jgi:hypothetical protein
MVSGDNADDVVRRIGFGTVGAIPVLRPPWRGAEVPG